MSGAMERMEKRRVADAARRLRKAADRTAGQLGALTTAPKTPARAREFRRLSALLDATDARATYYENQLKEMTMTEAQQAAIRGALNGGVLEAREVLTRENGDIAIITRAWTMLVTPDGEMTLWGHGPAEHMTYGGAQ